MTDSAQCPGPVVIGGVGGSGTRLIAALLRELGFYIGDDLNSANDNLWFTLLFVRPKWFARSSDEEIFQGLHLFEKSMLGRSEMSRDDIRVLRRAATDMLFSDYLHLGRDRDILPIRRVARLWPLKRLAIFAWTAKRITTMLRSRRCGSLTYARWGWKEPNSHVYIRHLSQFFQCLKYVHVIRHGLDMAYSSNQAQVRNWGSHFGVEMPDSTEALPKASLAYWIRANEAAMTLGSQLLGDRFLVVNFDELCLAPSKRIPEFVEFLGMDATVVNMDKLCGMCAIPLSLGRHKEHDLSIFDKDAIQRVQELGFSFDDGA